MNREIILAIVLGLIGGGVLVYFLFFAPAPRTTGLSDDDPLFAEGTVLPEREGAVESISPTTARYRNDRYFFTLEYPNELALKEIDEDGATTIVFQKPGELKGFQIFIVRYRDDAISDTRIRKDLQGAPMNNPKDIVLPGNIRAVHFESESPTLGSSTEVWFIYKGYLYEVTTYAEWDTELAGILGTLRFEQ
jgi:hypothetical protein